MSVKEERREGVERLRWTVVLQCLRSEAGAGVSRAKRGLNWTRSLEAGDWSFLSSLRNCDQLVYLCLDRNILEGALPSSIGHLPRTLQVLLLTSNKISGTIPQEIEHLQNLTQLYMEHNLLAGNLPDSIGNLPNLFTLSLSQNKLSGQVPHSIGNLSQLSELNL